MSATHKEEDEIKHMEGTEHFDITEEYYGICGVCHGDGLYFLSRHGCYDPCWNCGGDGKSVRED